MWCCDRNYEKAWHSPWQQGCGKRVLLDVLKAKEEITVYDPSNSLSRRNRKRLIEDGTDKACIIYKLAAPTRRILILLLQPIDFVLLEPHQSQLNLGMRFKR